MALSTALHARLDYLTAATTLSLPGAGLETRAWGVVALVSGVASKHELGVVRAVPMRAHLAIDGVGGAALAATPWLAGGTGGPRRWLPALLVGLSEVGLAALTDRSNGSAAPARERAQAVAGTAAIVYGSTRRSPAGAALVLAGGAAIAGAARAEAGPETVTVTIAAPVERVEPFLREPDAWAASGKAPRVELAAAPAERGTEVRARPDGKIAAARAREDLRRLKRLVETGEIATVRGQPAGRRSPLGRLLTGRRERVAR